MNERTINTIFIILFAVLGAACAYGVATGHPYHVLGVIFCCLMIWAVVRQEQEDNEILTFADLNEIYTTVMEAGATGEPHCEQIDLCGGRLAVVEYTVLRNYETGDDDVFVVAAKLSIDGRQRDITEDIRAIFTE